MSSGIIYTFNFNNRTIIIQETDQLARYHYAITTHIAKHCTKEQPNFNLTLCHEIS
jgi:hypothetical protein